MSIHSVVDSIWKEIRRLFCWWAVVTLLLCVVTAVSACLFSSRRGTMSAAVNLSYEGIESGLNPSGGQFDPSEMRSVDVINETLDLLAVPHDEEKTNRIRDAVKITGYIPRKSLERAMGYERIYEKNGVADSIRMTDRSYFPTQYTLLLDGKELGWSRNESARFLNALLKSYQDYFFKEKTCQKLI